MHNETMRVLKSNRKSCYVAKDSHVLTADFPSESAGENALISWTDYLVSFPIVDVLSRLEADVTLTRNLTDESGSTVQSLRPDLLIKVQGFPLFRCEEKYSERRFEKAKQELIKKSILSTLVFGDFPFNVGLTVCNKRFSFFLMNVGESRLHPLFDVRMTGGSDLIEHRLSCLSFSFSVGFFLGEALRKRPLPTFFFPRPYDVFQKENFRYVSIFNLTTYQKVFPSQRSCDFFEKLRADLKGVTFLSFIDSGNKSISEAMVENQRVIKLTMKVVGYPDLVPRTVKEWLQCLMNVLMCLTGMHRKGYCHGDVRMSNIVYVPQHPDIQGTVGWYLIDIEYACPFQDEGHIPKYANADFAEKVSQVGMSAELDMFMLDDLIRKNMRPHFSLPQLDDVDFSTLSSEAALDLLQTIQLDE